MVDVKKATELREQGYSYPEIAQELDCSVDWCKRNLKNVSKNKNEKTAITEAIKIAQSANGITNPEIRNLVRSVYPYEKSKEYEQLESKAMARFKAAIQRAPNTLIRPYWIDPANAQTSLHLVMSAVDNIMQSMNDEVDYIRRQLDYNQSYDMSLRYAIIKLLVGSGLVPEGAENHCDYLCDVVNVLEEREAKRTDPHYINICPKECAPKFSSVQKCIGAENTPIYEDVSEGVPIDLDDIPLWME